MKTIWKYPLKIEDEIEVTMPIGANILCVQMQDKQPCLWAVVDTEAELYAQTLYWYGTGNPFDETTKAYLGTIQTGGLVFHLFGKTKNWFTKEV